MAAAVVGQATITSTTGPGNTVTAQVYPGVTAIRLDLAKAVIALEFGDPTKTSTFDLSAVTTVTFAPATGAFVAS